MKLHEGIMVGTKDEKAINWPTETNHKILTGMKKTGKTTYLVNYALNAITSGETTFLIDCTGELHDQIRDYMPKKYLERLHMLDLSSIDLALEFGEINNIPENDNLSQIRLRGTLLRHTIKFLETFTLKISLETKKYLSAACTIVLGAKDISIQNILGCLLDEELREEMIKKSNIEETNVNVKILRTIDNDHLMSYFKTKQIDTIDNYMRTNSKINNMLTSELKLNLADITPGSCIVIKVHDQKLEYNTVNSLVTFIYSKIWLSIYANPQKCHIIVEDIYSFPQLTDLIDLNHIVSKQIGINYVLTSTSASDIIQLIRDMRSSQTNYMIFRITSEDSELMSSELGLKEFHSEDMANLRNYHSINKIGHYESLTRVPEPYYNICEYTDRTNISQNSMLFK